MNKNMKSVFYLFRYFIVHSGQQAFLEHKSEKRDIIKEINEICKKDKKISVRINDRQHILIYMKSYSKCVHLFKFCKDMTLTKYELNEQASDVIEVKESNLPYIYVIFDLNRQTIFLEKKTTVFHDINRTKNTFEKFVDIYFHDINYTFSMDEISETKNFWDNIEKAEGVYEVTLNLRSPNLFGGILKTNELLKNLQESYNNDETDITLKNTKGKLKIDHKTMDDPLKYASSGGGSWVLRIKKKGKRKTSKVTSKQNIKTVEFSHIEEELNIFSEVDILEKINSIDDILIKEKNDN